MSDLSSAEKRKYALAMRRIDYGIWGFKVSSFWVLTLTTREGDDNSVKQFGKDFRKLIAWFRKRGFRVEYCGVYELTPGKELLHWHGILRVRGGYFNITRRELGDKWNELHHAFVVKLEPVRKMAYLQKYINKHMVKDYLAEGVMRNKFLVSKGWSRRGVNDLIDEFKNWWLNVTGDFWMSNEGWAVCKIIIRRWCERENIKVLKDNGFFALSAGKVLAEIYSSED